ncbi:hypothetical protein B0T25DRAFT_557815 [Lasiosphaeria hispida]|uniref:DUF1776-domain-containing protein n=1 Tax=Lasiosphaeria hispida TaxID=260671 RepID=A0AAJ0H5Y4_9PEZI|nr:hypothetical protein B0T25DRAFT_557815 [Lasiosphaeria hispida]
MSADDQVFLDILSSLPNEIARYSSDIADFIDHHVEQISDSIRDTLASLDWIPENLRPQPPPPVPVILTVPTSLIERTQNWFSRNKILTGVVVGATGAIIYRMYRNNVHFHKPRRARRSRSGGRVEVVVVAGSPALPLTRSLSIDLERKGFAVYVVSTGAMDDSLIRGMARPDIQPLFIDITDPPSAGGSIERFAHFLQVPHAAVPNAKKHHLSLSAVILIPSLHYQTSPIATIPPSSFADLFNTHLLQPILTIQTFLPLLTARLGPADKFSPPKVLVLTPSIISSINPPFHAPQATVCSALTAFTEVLAGELRPLSIPVTHIQMGSLDFDSFSTRCAPHNHQRGKPVGLLPASEASNTLSWPDSARHTYGENYINQAESVISSGRLHGLGRHSIRELHNAVFDVIDGSNKSDVVRVGLGANVYGFVGRWVPRNLVSWMMGIRKVDELVAWQSSSSSSPSSGSDSGDMLAHDVSQESFIAVPLEHAAETHVWKEA